MRALCLGICFSFVGLLTGCGQSEAPPAEPEAVVAAPSAAAVPSPEIESDP